MVKDFFKFNLLIIFFALLGAFNIVQINNAYADEFYIHNGTLEEGEFNILVYNVGEISGGVFNNDVENHKFILSGTFNGPVLNNRWIENGIFNNTVLNKGANAEVFNEGTINNGTFNAEVFNEGTINNGTFNAEVFNEGTITGGHFFEIVENSQSGEIISGTFEKGIIGTVSSEAKIGNVYYATLDDAFKAAQPNDTIDLINDYTITTRITIPNEICLRIINGVTLTINEKSHFTNNGFVINEGIIINDGIGYCYNEGHAFCYDTEGKKIFETCTICKHQNLAELIIPENLVYNGQKHEVNLNGKLNGFYEIFYGEEYGQIAPTNAGEYTVTLNVGTGVNKVSVSVELVISKATVTITPISQEIEQFSDLPDFSFEYIGFIGNDFFITLPTVNSTANDTTQFGDFTLSASGAIVSDNYEVIYLNGNLTILEHKIHTDIENDGKCDLCKTVIETNTPTQPPANPPITPPSNESNSPDESTNNNSNSGNLNETSKSGCTNSLNSFPLITVFALCFVLFIIKLKKIN